MVIGAELDATAFWVVWGAVLMRIGRSYWRTQHRRRAIAAFGIGMLAISAAVAL